MVESLNNDGDLSRCNSGGSVSQLIVEAEQLLEPSPSTEKPVHKESAIIHQEVTKALAVCRQSILQSLSRLEVEHPASLHSHDASVGPHPLVTPQAFSTSTPGLNLVKSVLPATRQDEIQASSVQRAVDVGEPGDNTKPDYVAVEAHSLCHPMCTSIVPIAESSFADIPAKHTVHRAKTGGSAKPVVLRSCKGRTLDQIEQSAIAWGRMSSITSQSNDFKSIDSLASAKSLFSTLTEISSKLPMFKNASQDSRRSEVSVQLENRKSRRAFVREHSETLGRKVSKCTTNETNQSLLARIHESWYKLKAFANVLICMLIMADVVLMVLQINNDVAKALSLSEEHRGNHSMISNSTSTIEQPVTIHSHEDDVYQTLFVLIAVLFSIESLGHTLIKVLELKAWPPKKLILFDLPVVACSWLHMSQDTNLITISRLGRAMRLLRLLELAVRFFEPLKSVKSMIFIMYDLLGITLPVIVCLQCIFFLGSLAVMSGVRAYAAGENPDVRALERMNKDFGSLGISIKTFIDLFVSCKYQSQVYRDTISEFSWGYILLYQLIWFLIYYNVHMVIVAEIFVYVDKIRKPNTQEVLAEMAAEEQEHAARLLEIMKEHDYSDDGILQHDEFESFLDNPLFATYLDLLNISPRCLAKLFDSLHSESQDGVEISLFVEAILANRGVARKFEVSWLVEHMENNAESSDEGASDNNDGST